jgi:hypothetical protein
MSSLCGLKEEDAQLLARYLVEDSVADYVYCDPNNEQLRTCVKSIVKTVIGDYSLPRDLLSVVKQANEII